MNGTCNRSDHVDGLVELYALGSLDATERAAVERHVRSCAECARVLHQAEISVLALAEYEEQHEPPPRLGARLDASLRTPAKRTQMLWMRPILAAAAVLVIAIVPAFSLWGRDRSMRTALATDDAAFARIAAGSFEHAAFKGSAAAKVLYSRDGSWYYVNLPVNHKMNELALLQNGRVVADVELRYER